MLDILLVGHITQDTIMLKARHQLDELLKYFYNKIDDANPMDIDKVKSDNGLLEMAGNKSELERMIIKLRDDKYVHIYPDYYRLPDGKQDMKGGMFTMCTITFDGRLFFENGGYVKEEQTTLNVEKIKNNRERRLSDGTVLLAIATFLLVLTEVLIHWNELLHVFSCR